MSPPGQALRSALEVALGDRVAGMERVQGGDVAIAYRVDLARGIRLFAKTHPSPPADFFTTEAASLTWLRAAAAVAVPAVVAVSDGPPAFLALEWVDEGRARPTTEVDLGRGLAALHGAGAPCFGRDDGRTSGSLALPNDPHATWAQFQAACRFLPLARLAADTGSLPPATVAALERLAHTLDRFDDGAGPARLHGDLWAGNRLVDTAGRSWLVDPASHGGHRETDLAMMRLFGGFGADCFAAYAETHPLAPGWPERVALHQIVPLVVHAIHFGRGYVAAASQAIARY